MKSRLIRRKMLEHVLFFGPVVPLGVLGIVETVQAAESQDIANIVDGLQLLFISATLLSLSNSTGNTIQRLVIERRTLEDFLASKSPHS